MSHLELPGNVPEVMYESLNDENSEHVKHLRMHHTETKRF